MSLTTFLDKPDVKQKFKEFFNKPNFVPQVPLLVEPLSQRYSIVGTAFDYLLRFHLEYWHGLQYQRHWVAEDALVRIATTREQKLIRFARDVLERIRRFHSDFLTTGTFTDDLIKGAIMLAHFDSVFRAAHVSPHIIQRASFPKSDVLELQKLLEIIPQQPFHSAQTIFLNPTFDEASVMVGGADADLILDDMLIDIKTTKYFVLSREHLNQLLGYYLLHRIDYSNRNPGYTIRRLGIYFSRYGYLYSFDVETCFQAQQIENAKQWLLEYCQQSFE